MKTSLPLVPAAAILSLGALLNTGTPGRATDVILHNFAGGSIDGSNPYSSLTLSGSKLYGMTYDGGGVGGGTLFSMNTDGTGFGLLHSFTGGSIDGRNPWGSLTLSGSKLYGMTASGGSGETGTLFSMNTDGTGFGLLHSFTGGAGDPNGSLTLSGSKLYGMTSGGGNSSIGAVFSMNTDGTGFGLLHTFTGGAGDGAYPRGSLTLSGSKLYGMTQDGGSDNVGTLFSMNTDGTGFSLLHIFAVGPGDGAYPSGSLTLSGSKLYGMASNGGAAGGYGALFSMNIDGTGFGLLHSFAGAPGDGENPAGSLTLSGSKLYGMTYHGGTRSDGTLFSMNTDGTDYGLLESFGGAPADGDSPRYGELTLSGDGSTLYGMTQYGGTANLGVIFSWPEPAPEPGTAVLLLGGCALLALRRRPI